MPRYDYRCESCAHEFELRQTFQEAGNGTCPSCTGRGQRVYHAVPVIYKGSGFYTTDYGRPKAPVEGDTKDSSKDTKSTSDTNSTSDTSTSSATSDSKTKTESAPAATNESST